ncbi:MAG: hypothetical protein KGJ23_10745 [Euryarchaeota archaeon]|nr:hypothetical protein [Euryarchaeota archaeon]MDE1837081.1 hypothetical protein [Euryarchaeota archaeon]MDE1881508.1 hypothetical protein [Euryarchaeota archaeon]MDE2046612.1 hypothetical protein [Thermoplasmata archaeon]
MSEATKTGATGAHDHSQPSGRSTENLGLCEVSDLCRKEGHTIARTTLPRKTGEAGSVGEVCLSCTEHVGRLEGLRLWQSVCPCCFSSAFPEGMPTLSQSHSRARP